MYRAYYVIRKLKPLKAAVEQLENAGVGHNRIHVLARDNGMLERAGINHTTFWEDTDIMPAGYRGAWVGFAVGAVTGLLLVGADPFAVDLGAATFFAVTALFTCFGAWAGGLAGISGPQHHLRRYLGRVRRGAFLVMVDVDREEDVRTVKRILRQGVRGEKLDIETDFSPLA
ncbi:MAG: hypothetical protein P1U64_01855 [Alcanivoracaceae bacterium]|jgi:hypothetical protein|nr:hypothetical protein [Alcanivoracaceae bacterium]